MDIEAQASEWGPGSNVARLGRMHLWMEATRQGCCELPDGWGADRLPQAMEQVVRRWEEEHARQAGQGTRDMFRMRCPETAPAAAGNLWAGYSRQAPWGHLVLVTSPAGAVGSHGNGGASAGVASYSGSGGAAAPSEEAGAP